MGEYYIRSGGEQETRGGRQNRKCTRFTSQELFPHLKQEGYFNNRRIVYKFMKIIIEDSYLRNGNYIQNNIK
jgi:hypothetical protein